MTGENKTVEPNKGNMSGSLSVNKKDNSAKKNPETNSTEDNADLTQKAARGRMAKTISLLTLRCKQTGGKLTWNLRL